MIVHIDGKTHRASAVKVSFLEGGIETFTSKDTELLHLNSMEISYVEFMKANK